jgi:hypothetical protein
MTGDQPISKRRTAGQQHHARQITRDATAAAIPWLMRFPRRFGSDPVTSGTAQRDDTVGYVVLGWGQGTAAADEASRGKMAQIKWQRRHRPAQRSCQAI